jgi:orotate phosphoribosyltransferase
MEDTILARLVRSLLRNEGSPERVPLPLKRVLKAYEKMLVTSGAVKVADGPDYTFSLRNGASSSVYVDHGDLLCYPKTNKVLLKALKRYVVRAFPADRTILANVDSKASPQLTGAIAATVGYRQIVVLPETTYENERGLRLRLRVPSDVAPEDRIVIIDDVLTPNDMTAVRIAHLVRADLRARLGSAADTIEVHLVVGLARDPLTARAELAEHGVKVHWLTTLPQVLDGLLPSLQADQQDCLSREFPSIREQMAI